MINHVTLILKFTILANFIEIKAWKLQYYSKVFLNKNFKVKSRDTGGVFVATFILSLFKTDDLIKVWTSKQDRIYFNSI